MKRTVLWALGALNVLLLASLLSPYFGENQAMAQRAGGGGGRRPDLMLIPGEIIGGNSAVVYLIDTNNRQLAAITLNQRGNGIDAMPVEDLDRNFADRAVPAPGGNPKGGRKP